MPASQAVAAHIAACRAILGSTNEPAGIAWNTLKPGFRAALLKIAGLSETFKHRRWEELSIPAQHRIKQTAIESEGLRRFLSAAEQFANPKAIEVLQ